MNLPQSSESQLTAEAMMVLLMAQILHLMKKKQLRYLGMTKEKYCRPRKTNRKLEQPTRKATGTLSCLLKEYH